MSYKAVLANLEWNIFIAVKHSGQHLRSVLQLLLLGKLINHFWEIKSNPEKISQSCK